MNVWEAKELDFFILMFSQNFYNLTSKEHGDQPATSTSNYWHPAGIANQLCNFTYKYALKGD